MADKIFIEPGVTSFHDLPLPLEFCSSVALHARYALVLVAKDSNSLSGKKSLKSIGLRESREDHAWGS